MQTVKALVSLAKNEPATVTTIHVPDPIKGEALVKVRDIDGGDGGWLIFSQ